jgi:hypothetical protein
MSSYTPRPMYQGDFEDCHFLGTLYGLGPNGQPCDYYMAGTELLVNFSNDYMSYVALPASIVRQYHQQNAMLYNGLMLMDSQVRAWENALDVECIIEELYQ